MLPGSVVEPDEPTCRISNIPAFQVGYWNGLYHSPAMLNELVENFQRFGNYKPYGTINHEDVLACGKVTGARFDGRTLFLDLANIPEVVGKAWNAGQLHAPSIEYWDTRENMKHRLGAGFRLPNGQPPGLVLRCVTLCGNGAPAVKTLGPMPKAVYEASSVQAPPVRMMDNWRAFGDAKEFANLPPATRRFSSEDFMDQQAIMASLKAADPSLSDAFLAMLNPQQLAALLDAKQGAAAAGTVADATAGGGAAGGAPGGLDAPGGAPGLDAPGGEPPLDANKMMADCGGSPEKMASTMKKFLDLAIADRKAAADEMSRAKSNVSKLESQLKLQLANSTAGVTKIVDDRIKQFMDGPAANRIPPAARPRIEKLLRKCDATQVRKFSDGKTLGSELEEEMAEVLKSFPVGRGFVRQFSDAAEGTVSPGGGGDINTRVGTAVRICNLLPEMAQYGVSMQKRFAPPAGV